MRILLPFAFAFMLFIPATLDQVRLPKLISDGMVLQRDVSLKVWGWTTIEVKSATSTFKSIFFYIIKRVSPV